MQLVIFDFDGLILDTEAPVYDAWQAIYAEHGHRLDFTRWAECIGTADTFDPCQHLEALLGEPLDAAPLRQRHRRWADALIAAQPVLPGVREYMDEASRLGLRLGVALSSSINADDGEPRLVVNKAFEWVGSVIARATVPPPPTADAAWQRDVGRYRNAWGDLQVLVGGGRLTLIGPALLDPLPVHATLAPIGPHTFRLESKDGYSSHGEPVVFEIDGVGKVARVTIGPNASRPVEAW